MSAVAVHVCSVPGCPAPTHARGMCIRHYQRVRRYGDPEAPLRVRRSRRRWTAHDLFQLEGGIEAGWNDETIARKLGCTVEAMRMARKRHGLRSRRRVLMSARAVADLLGIGCSKTVVRWIERGWLAGRRGPGCGPYQQWLVWEERLLKFLEDETHWHRWQAERITEPCLREWALELRAGVRFLTLAEVAERCYVTISAVQAWIHAGRLPALRNGNHVVRESDLVGFVPPGQRSRAGLRHRAWTTDEDAVLREMRAAGVAYAAIAQRLGRSISSVANRWWRVGRGV